MIGLRLQLLHLGTEGEGTAFSAGKDAAGLVMAMIAVVPPHNALDC